MTYNALETLKKNPTFLGKDANLLSYVNEPLTTLILCTITHFFEIVLIQKKEQTASLVKEKCLANFQMSLAMMFNFEDMVIRDRLTDKLVSRGHSKQNTSVFTVTSHPPKTKLEKI